ncbi:MAG: DNA polymerase IV [Chloroflexi bacterium]|nr:DNA polymerase IV [Chloroflexota bacterium]
MSNRTIMHVDLDAFFVSVEQALNPELRGKPVVVGGSPEGRGVVAAASYEARKFGLHSAMPLKTAVRLCPQAIFLPGNFHRYRDASHKFMAILADFTPFIEPMGLDEAYLDVTGFESLHGSIRQMALEIKRRIKDELGLPASVGIASNKVVAKVACEQSKPDGLIEVPKGGERDFLAPLPVGELPGVGEKAEQILARSGIKTIAQLANTPSAALKSRFGVFGEDLQRRARGIGSDKVEPPAAAKSISRETTFGRDTRSRPFLKATLRYLAEKVGADLRRQEKQARCVTVKLRYADFTTITRSHTLKLVTDNDDIIFATGARLMEKALSLEKQPVRLIGIGVSNLVEPGGQLSFLDSPVQRLAQLDRTIDRIRDKYGFTAIQTGQTLLLKDVFPEDEKDYSLHTPSLSR